MPPEDPRYCNRCGYPVHHQPRGTCPECGTRHDRDLPRTWSRHPVPAARRRMRALVRATAWTAAVYVLALLVATGSDQYDVAHQVFQLTNTDDPASLWLTLNYQHFNPVRLPRLFIGSAVAGVTITLGHQTTPDGSNTLSPKPKKVSNPAANTETALTA